MSCRVVVWEQRLVFIYEAVPEYLPCKTFKDLNYFLMANGENVGNRTSVSSLALVTKAFGDVNLMISVIWHQAIYSLI